MSEEIEGLFEVEAKARLLKGQPVTVQTIYGDEPGLVVDVLTGSGRWPMVEVLMELGDTISISVARVQPRGAL